MLNKKENRKKRAKKAKFMLKQSPRLRVVVNRTSKHFSAQVIDDSLGNTVLSSSTLGKSFAEGSTGNIEAAIKVGELLGQKAKESGINEIVFDRNGYKYHGRVKAFADALRSSGVQF